MQAFVNLDNVLIKIGVTLYLTRGKIKRCDRKGIVRQ